MERKRGKSRVLAAIEPDAGQIPHWKAYEKFRKEMNEKRLGKWSEASWDVGLLMSAVEDK